MDDLLRLPTGNAELDQILGGGFPRGSINILMGEPGSGKSVFAESMVFANTRPGDRPSVYLATLAEPLDKFVRYLQQFPFFDADALGRDVFYDSMGDQLLERGIDAVVAKVEEVIKARRPQIIVIDSFKVIHDLSSSPAEQRQMLYQLTSLLTAYDTTAFLIGEYEEDEMRSFPEFAIADGVVELLRTKTTARDERFLRVLKLRGSGYQQGMHAFQITPAGLAVFPRLVSPTEPPRYEQAADQITTGIAGLDNMLVNGLMRGSVALVAGPPGAGKTTLGLQFALAGARNQEPTLYVNFQENPTQLERHLRSLGASGAEIAALDFFYASPVELQIDSILVAVFHRIKERGIRRIVLDAVGDLATASGDPQRVFNYLYALSQHLAVIGVTALMTFELPHPLVGPGGEVGRFSALCDALIVLDLDLGERPRRTIRVLKARGVGHDLKVREMQISHAGVTVT